MAEHQRVAGKIITFYSYKGGVGRSMALANVVRCVTLAAPQSQRVLAIDWDLDAPGLHRFFPRVDLHEGNTPLGLIDYFVAMRGALDSDKTLANAINTDEGLALLEERVPLDKYIIRDAAPRIDLMLAGQFMHRYRQEVLAFQWADFYEKHPAALRVFRELITRQYGYCFIDSRTGYTDISGICTALMPEKLVALFVPNEQNLEGLLSMIEVAVEYRRKSNDSRPLAVFPVASRIDNSEQAEKVSWLLRFQYAFEKLFRRLYDSDCDLTAHFDKVQFPNIGYYSYGERIAMLDEDRSQTGSLRFAYEAFAERLLHLSYPWEAEHGES